LPSSCNRYSSASPSWAPPRRLRPGTRIAACLLEADVRFSATVVRECVCVCVCLRHVYMQAHTNHAYFVQMHACLPPRDAACTAACAMHQAAVPTQRAGVRGATCALEHSPSRRRVLCLASALVSATVSGTLVCALVRARECAGLCASRWCEEREKERGRE